MLPLLVPFKDGRGRRQAIKDSPEGRRKGLLVPPPSLLCVLKSLWAAAIDGQ